MSITSLWRVILIACFSLFITACKPVADFFYEPAPTTVGQVTSFNASGTIITDEAAEEELEAQKHKEKDKDKKPKPPKPSKKQVIYNWNFGDGSSGSGITATHIYSTAGTYTATLTVKDRDGKVGTISKLVIVKPLGALSQIDILVQGIGGTRISGANVSIGAITASTSSGGTANLSALSGNQTVVISKPGYVSQALNATLSTKTVANLSVLMLQVKEVQTITDIELAQKINAKTLGAFVDLPDAALVNPDGTNAKGTVTLQLTPWDIAGSDLNAMLGNGKALVNGQTVDLISAGMLTVDFFNAANQHLQLAPGKTATIQMDLPYTSIGGQALREGSTIPLWTFKESQGVWVQEGTGTVVLSPKAATGLAVNAVVGHFSTWNWDFKFNNGGTVTVQCKEGAVTVACSILAEVTLPDGSRITRSSYSVIDTVTTVINMPTEASIIWTGTTPGGQVGVTSSGASGNVVIQLSAPKTNNFVQCFLPDGSTPVACNAILTATDINSQPATRSFALAAEGLTVKTAIDTTSLAWQAASRLVVEGTDLVRYSGSITSGITGNVSIVLANRVVVDHKTLYVSCDPVADVVDYIYDPITGSTTQLTTTAALTSCDINVYAYSTVTNDYYQSSILNVAPGTTVPVVLPPLNDTDWVNINVSGVTNYAPNGYQANAYKYLYFNNDQVANNQFFPLRLLWDSCGGECAP
jgi:PKD repeat protein